MAVCNKFSCSCGKSPKQKPVLSEGFVNYLQIDSHNNPELMNLKMWEHNYSLISRTHGPEDARIQASIHEAEDMRMWGCNRTSKHIWTWRHEDVRMQVYKEAHMNLRIWICKDARIRANTYKLEDMRMWGCKDTSKHTRARGYEGAGMQTRAYEPEDMKM